MASSAASAAAQAAAEPAELPGTALPSVGRRAVPTPEEEEEAAAAPQPQPKPAGVPAAAMPALFGGAARAPAPRPAVKIDLSEFGAEISGIQEEEKRAVAEEVRVQQARVAAAVGRSFEALPTQCEDSRKLHDIVVANYERKFKGNPRQEFIRRKAARKAARAKKKGETYADRLAVKRVLKRREPSRLPAGGSKRSRSRRRE